jgi:hypothetical protein
LADLGGGSGHQRRFQGKVFGRIADHTEFRGYQQIGALGSGPRGK